MGLFFHMNSLALSEDLPGLDKGFTDYRDFDRAATHAYAKVNLIVEVETTLEIEN